MQEWSSDSGRRNLNIHKYLRYRLSTIYYTYYLLFMIIVQYTLVLKMRTPSFFILHTFHSSPRKFELNSS